MIAPNPSTTFSLPPGERPLGIQRPFLPPTPLGQSLVQPKFLMPLGARSLTVLDPAINRSSDQAPAPDWQAPVQEAPFFDAPELQSPAPNLSIHSPTLQTKSLSAPEDFNNPSMGLPESSPAFQPIANLDTSERDTTERSIAQPSAASFNPTIDSPTPTIDAQPNSVDAFVSLSALKSDASMERFVEDIPATSSDALTAPPSETPSHSSTASTQVFPLPDLTNQRHNSPTASSETTPLSTDPSPSLVEAPVRKPVPVAEASIALPSPAADPSQENVAFLSAQVPTTSTVAQADVLSVPSVTDALTTNTLVSESSVPTIVQPATETSAAASAPPIATRSTTTESSVAAIQLRSDAAEALIAEAQSPLTSELPTEASTAASNYQVDSGATVPDVTVPDAITPAIELSGLEASTPPSHVESVVQPFRAEPSTVTPIAPISLSEAFLPDPLSSHSSNPDSQIDSSLSDANLKAVSPKPMPADKGRSPTEPISMPDVPAANVMQATHEQGDVEAIVDHPVDRSIDRSGGSAETVPSKTLPDVVDHNVSETVQRKVTRDRSGEALTTFNVDETFQQKQIKSDAVELVNTTPIDAISTPSLQATPIVQPLDPAVKTPLIETPFIQPLPTIVAETSVEQAHSSFGALSETEQANEAQTAIHPPNIAQSGFETSAASALEPQQLQIPVQPDGIEAVIQPTIQPNAENPTDGFASPTALAEMPMVPSSQEHRTEASQPATTMQGLNASTLPVQASGTAIDPVNVDPVNSDAATAAPSVLNEPDLNETDLNEAEREATINQINALPALPTSIQRLSVWEPLVQMQPLASTVALSANQPAQTASYPAIATNQVQPFNPQLDRSVAKESNGFDAVLASDVVSRKAEVAPIEWSNIADLLDSIEESRDNASSPAATTAANGYADLNLHPEISTTSPNALQRKPDLATIDPATIDQPTNIPPANPATSAEASNQQAPSSQQQSPNASPEQFERLAQAMYRLVRQRLALERERVGTLYTGRSM